MPAYRPDDESYIKRFQEVFDRVPEFIQLFAERESFASKARVFGAWCAWQPEAAERLQALGAYEFYERLVRCLGDAEEGLGYVVARYSGHDEEVESIDEIGSCHDPLQLLSMLSGDFMGYRPTVIGQFEIARKLTIATQLLLIAAADPYEWVTQDLSVVNVLVDQRLYEPDVRQRLDVRFTLEPKLCRVDITAPLAVSLSEGERLSKVNGPGSWTKRYVCRAVKDGDKIFFLYTSSRLKQRMSSVFRLERRARLTDRRGLAQVVVAVHKGRVIRPATRTDVEHVVDIIRERLWRDPLVPEDDISLPNDNSSTDYWDRKMVGRFMAHHGFPVAAPIEQQVTSLVDRLNAEHARDRLGHAYYKGEIIRQYILPRWFPRSHYGIDWAAESRLR